MDESLLLTVQSAGQAGDDVLITPALSADKYYFAGDFERIRIVTPDNQIIEKDAEFGIPFDTASLVYLLLIPNTNKDEVPVGSQIWKKKSLEEITRHSDTPEE